MKKRTHANDSELVNIDNWAVPELSGNHQKTVLVEPSLDEKSELSK